MSEEIKTTETEKIRKKYATRIKTANFFTYGIRNPLWLSVSELAHVTGTQTKTIRRAIQSHSVTYKVVNNRYLVDFGSVIKYFYASSKLRNKLNENGVGQYIDRWKP